MSLFLHNTLTRKKEHFQPLDASNIRMYVCGPTVYGRAHLGNARSVVVYDVLYRLLRHLYGADYVTYVRNITDVDDKINAAAKERKITIKELTTEVTQWFHDDMAALNVLPASSESHSREGGNLGQDPRLRGGDNKEYLIFNGIMIEPKATDHISYMINMIERLFKNGQAYEAQGHVLFSVRSEGEGARGEKQKDASKSSTLDPRPYYYGMLSGRIQEDLESGSRVKVESYKRDPNDFVLWKPADSDDDPSSVFDSPWGKGRPGWHIECSAMSTHYLGHDFDIHGGGSDLMFPHHENEIAQSIGAFPGSHFAKYWVHNGFLTVNGEKMSKSLGNFITVRDLLDKGVKGEVIRYALLKTKYNEPLDWSEKLLSDAKKELDYFYRVVQQTDLAAGYKEYQERNERYTSAEDSFTDAIKDDLNIPRFLGSLHIAITSLRTNNQHVNLLGYLVKKYLTEYLGLLNMTPDEWFKGDGASSDIESLIAARNVAKKAKNWAEADKIRNELKSQGILLEDRPDGTSDWRKA